LDDLHPGMPGDNLANALIPRPRIHVGAGLKQIQDLAVTTHQPDQFLGRVHGRALDVGAHGKRDGSGQGRLRAVGHNILAVVAQELKQGIRTHGIAGKKAESLVTRGG
jgi:hypothetical protein